jgi:hypothetical protein
MRDSKITQQNDIIIDSETGEIINQARKEVLSVGKEPSYYKVYINDLANLQGLNPTEKKVLEILSANMSIDNIIVVIKPIKEKLAIAINGSFESVKKAIIGLTKKGILLKEERACYRVNPKYIAKGKWEDIKALRLVIEYSAKGREISIEKVTPHHIEYKVSDPNYKINEIDEKIPPNQSSIDFERENPYVMPK